MLKSSFSKKMIEAGCDEAGRGSLAGPVVAAAVILPRKFKCSFLNDSKQTSEKKRKLLKTIIEENAIVYSIGIASTKEIDQINVLNASFLAMHRALTKINVKIQLLLIDGNKFISYQEIKHQCIVKGDAKFLSIAAASILAKNYRDTIMKKLDLQKPIYNWKRNKGYPTKEHRRSIKIAGITSYHRKSFKLL